MQIRLHISGLKPKGNITTNPNQGHYSGPPKQKKHEGLTYSRSDDDPSGEKHEFIRGESETEGARGENEACDDDDELPADLIVEYPTDDGKERGAPYGDGDDHLLPDGIEEEPLAEGDHGAGDHPGVVPEQEPADGREEREDVDERRGGDLVLDLVHPQHGVLPVHGCPHPAP